MERKSEEETVSVGEEENDVEFRRRRGNDIQFASRQNLVPVRGLKRGCLGLSAIKATLHIH